MGVPAWTLVVPIKPPESAKSRLVDLPAATRRELAAAFARDALESMLGSPHVDQVIVIGDTDIPQAMVGDRLHLHPDPGLGLAAAIDAGLALCQDSAPTAVVVADLPALRTDEITRALESGWLHRMSVICDRAGTGSTMLMGQHRSDLRPRFGERSRAAHVAAGAIDLVDLDVPGLRCDVDTAVDLWDARRLGVGRHTRAALAAP